MRLVRAITYLTNHAWRIYADRMSILLAFGSDAVEIAHLMKFRRYFREAKIPAFQHLREVILQETKSALERFAEFTPDGPDLALFDLVYGDMYKDMHIILEREWQLLSDQIETIETRVRQLTGKSADELESEGQDFWDECNSVP